MKNFVGVRVADAAEEMWIGQRALERMVFSLQGGLKLREIRLEHFEPSSIVFGQCFRTADHVERCLPLAASLGEDKCAVVEVERQKTDLARNWRGGLFPPEASRDHQMEHKVELVVQLEDDALADAAQRDDRLSRNSRQRGIDRTE